jgi:ubiquinone/menaquinone biosynthesis C-methylase UbiE
MKDKVDDIIKMYDQDPAYEHERLIRHSLEYELTCRLLKEYIPMNANVLEIGAASGRYTLFLCKQGCSVTAVDFSRQLLELNKQMIRENGFSDKVQFIHADARNLDKIEESIYDAVLLMGPLYHLIYLEDRQKAVSEASRCLKKGGLIFSAFISRLGIFGDLMKNIPDWIFNEKEVNGILEKGYNPDHKPEDGFRGYFADVAEIEPLHQDAGFETISLAGVEPAISADDESFNRLDEQQKTRWLDLLYKISGESCIIGSSRHLLYIGRK